MSQNDSEDPYIVHSKHAKIDYPIISYGEYFHNQLKKFNDKTLLIDAETNESLTGKEIINMAKTVAVSLLKYITKDDLIIFFSNNNIPYAITMIAAYFLGVPITQSKPSNNVFELKNQIIDSGATILFTSVANAPITKETINDLNNSNQLKHMFVLDGHYDNGFIPYENLNQNKNNDQLKQIPYFPIDPKNDILLICYTSGTTGLPKGAIMTHYYNTSLMYNFQIIYKNSIVLCYYPFGHFSGNIALGASLINGTTLILLDNMKFENIASAVEKYKVTYLSVTPSFGAALIDGRMDNYDLSSVTVMRCGGVSFPSDLAFALIKKYKLTAFVELYGMTEGFVCFNQYPYQDYVPGDVGTVMSNTEMKIIDLNTGKSLPENERGEICFRGPLMFKGYINNPQATASTIDSLGWLHTGDVGYYNENGHLFITDRIKEIVKFRMISVFPTEVESCLNKHDSIADSVVIGVKHKTDGQWLRAYILLKRGKVISAEEIQKYIRDRMAFQKELRAGIVFVDHMPRTIIGKIDRQFFKDMCKDEIITDKC